MEKNWMPEQNMSHFDANENKLNLIVVSGSSQIKVFTVVDVFESTTACHWFTLGMYAEHSGATSWEETCLYNLLLGLFQVQEVGKLYKKKSLLETMSSCQGKNTQRNLCAEQRLWEERVFSSSVKKRKDLWGWKCSPTFDKRVCTGMNASVWRVIKLCWSIHHAAIQ